MRISSMMFLMAAVMVVMTAFNWLGLLPLSPNATGGLIMCAILTTGLGAFFRRTLARDNLPVAIQIKTQDKMGRDEESYGVLYIFGLPIVCDLYAADAIARIDWALRVHPLWRRACSIRWSRTSMTGEAKKVMFADIPPHSSIGK